MGQPDRPTGVTGRAPLGRQAAAAMVSPVIEDVDDALRAFLAEEVAGGRTKVSFDPPTPEWEKSVKGADVGPVPDRHPREPRGPHR